MMGSESGHPVVPVRNSGMDSRQHRSSGQCGWSRQQRWRTGMERQRRLGTDLLHDWSAHQHDPRRREGRTDGLATDTMLALPAVPRTMIRTGVFLTQPGALLAGMRMIHSRMRHAGMMTLMGPVRRAGRQVCRLQQRA
jgi:hypothetical protein